MTDCINASVLFPPIAPRRDGPRRDRCDNTGVQRRADAAFVRVAPLRSEVQEHPNSALIFSGPAAPCTPPVCLYGRSAFSCERPSHLSCLEPRTSLHLWAELRLSPHSCVDALTLDRTGDGAFGETLEVTQVGL